MSVSSMSAWTSISGQFKLVLYNIMFSHPSGVGHFVFGAGPMGIGVIDVTLP